jgi:hypothetical protein
MKTSATGTPNRSRVYLAVVLMIAGLIFATSVSTLAQNLHLHSDVVRAYSTDVYHMTFIGREWEALVVSGDGSTDLDLYVYDENNNLIAKDDDNTDDCAVRFIPRWTGNFTVKVVNRGKYANTYTLGTN